MNSGLLVACPSGTLRVKHRHFAPHPSSQPSTAGKLVTTRANDETSTTPIRHAFHGWSEPRRMWTEEERVQPVAEK